MTTDVDGPRHGADYVARVDLFDQAGVCVAARGASCARVDPRSLPWLLTQGLIVPTAATPAAEEERG